MELHPQLLAVDLVAGPQGGPAAVGSDAGHGGVQAQDRAARRRQLGVASPRSQLLLRVAGGVEGEGGRPDSGQAQPAPGEEDLVAVGVAAVLLGPDVVLVEVDDVGTEGPVVAGAVLVDVALLRAQAVVVDLAHGLGQEEAQSQARQAGEAQCPAQSQVQAQDAVVGEAPDEPSAQGRLDRGRHEADVGADGDAPGLLVDVDAVGAGHGLVVVGALPLQARVAVVVGGRPPDVELHRALKELAALRGQGHGQAGARVDGAAETVTVDLDPGALPPDRQAGLADGAVGE